MEPRTTDPRYYAAAREDLLRQIEAARQTSTVSARLGILLIRAGQRLAHDRTAASA